MAATVDGVVLTRLLLLLLLFTVASCTVPVVEAVQLLATVPKKIALPKIATMGTLSHAAATAAAAEAAAIVRHNMMSGATIFTVGDIAAQLFTMITAARLANDAKTSKECTTTAVTSNNSDDDTTTLAPTTVSSTRTAAVLPHGVAIRRRLVQGKTLLLQLDVHRLATATFLGALYSGYAVPFVYGNVEACFPGRGNFQQICTKVLITCSILSTMGNYATLFARRFIAEALLVMANKNKNKTNKKTTTSTSTTNTHDNNNNNNNRNHLDTDTTSSSSFSSRLKLIQSQIGTLFRDLVRTVLLFGRIFQNCYQSCNQDILKVIRDDLKIWPIYDFTCYSYIQPCYRPLTTSIMSSGWAMYMSIVSAKEQQQQQQQQYEHELIQLHRNDDENDDEDRNKTMECIQKDEQKQKQYNDVEIAATIIETDISSITTTADNNNGADENETNKVSSSSSSSSSSSIAETMATTMISTTGANGTGTSIDCPTTSFSDNNPVQQRKNNRISLSKQLGVASH